MKIHELTDEQCAKIVNTNPRWVANNLPEWLMRHFPSMVYLYNFKYFNKHCSKSIPEDILALLNKGGEG